MHNHAMRPHSDDRVSHEAPLSDSSHSATTCTALAPKGNTPEARRRSQSALEDRRPRKQKSKTSAGDLELVRYSCRGGSRWLRGEKACLVTETEAVCERLAWCPVCGDCRIWFEECLPQSTYRVVLATADEEEQPRSSLDVEPRTKKWLST
jgi:hypothetical protein